MSLALAVNTEHQLISQLKGPPITSPPLVNTVGYLTDQWQSSTHELMVEV